MKTISTTTSEEFYTLAKEHKIKMSEALKVGLAVLFGEKGIRQYDNSLNLQRRIMASRIKAEQALQELIKLEEKDIIAIEENANT